MPYRWTEQDTTGRNAPLWRLCLWPHRSLSPRGFVTFIALTSAMLSLPILAALGTPVLWVLLPFLAGAVALVWHFLRRSYADAALREDLALWRDRIELVRIDPRGPAQNWQADPFRVRLEMHETGGPVANYLTLTGAGRAVEIGAFLSPDERVLLYRDLSDRLRRLDVNAPA